MVKLCDESRRLGHRRSRRGCIVARQFFTGFAMTVVFVAAIALLMLGISTLVNAIAGPIGG